MAVVPAASIASLRARVKTLACRAPDRVITLLLSSLELSK
jgi:hypothetical protein